MIVGLTKDLVDTIKHFIDDILETQEQTKEQIAYNYGLSNLTLSIAKYFKGYQDNRTNNLIEENKHLIVAYKNLFDRFEQMNINKLYK